MHMKRHIVIVVLLLCSFPFVAQNSKRIHYKSSIEQDIPMKMAGSLCFPNDSIPVDNVHVCSSEDGKMKFYSWEIVSDGVCQNYAVICQFLNEGGKIVTEDFRVREEGPGWVLRVHSIKKNDGTTYYITTRNQRISRNEGFTWMDGFLIDGDTLRNVSVLDGGDDLDECMLEINHRIDDWNISTNGEGWDWLFEYDAETMVLYVPNAIYVDDSIPSFNDRYRLYHFNGIEFVYQGEVPHKGLHASLHSYARLIKYFRTNNHIVRIDELESGAYRFASWESTADISKNPELVIGGGMYDAKNNCYTFINDSNEYKVGCCDELLIMSGFYGLIVQKNGKTLLKEEIISNTN